MRDKQPQSTVAPTPAAAETVGEQLLQSMQFQFPLRKYQEEILALVDRKLENGERSVHIVAPPGAGKTIIGLQLISKMKCPSLILSPNTTIQSQWGQKVDLFLPPDLAPFGTSELLGTHEDKPLKPVTTLTYQVLSTPGREQEYLEKLAHDSWIKELTNGRSITVGEAELRLLDLLQNNPKSHQRELSRHVSKLRRRLAEVMNLADVLHPNALDLLQALRRQKFKLVIFDECHHLTDYWAAIMTHLVSYLGDPVIIGLTGTPPEGKTATQETRYLSLVGDIDYQVPTPALVREGGLAPFQDLVYFTQPTEKEFAFLEEQHQDFHVLIEELTAPVTIPDWQVVPEPQAKDPDAALPPLSRWVKERVFNAVQKDVVKLHPANALQQVAKLKQKRGKAGTADDATKEKAAKSKKKADNPEPQDTIACSGGWTDLLHTQSDLTLALCRYMWHTKIPLPRNIEVSETLTQSPTIDDWMRVLDDFAAHKLKTSSDKADHQLFDRIRVAARKLGYGITEQGLRKQASPVDRVLAFSNSKPQAVAKILTTEYAALQEHLRVVVVTDFERMSATSIRAVKDVLDEESGGAVACMKTLLADPISEDLNPCLVTGSLLLTDSRITDRFVAAAEEYLASEGHSMKLQVHQDEGCAYAKISANSSSWESKLYVGMATAIFERGLTKCLVGTRGLFGEGWDSQALNTLIDLTTTTSPVSVKQLRGRSIRIQTKDPLSAHKVANNWDVVCIAPQLEKGLNDYMRFARKHDCFFGMSDDGHIERGVSHVHPAFSDLTPVEVFASSEHFNDEMIERSLFRERMYQLWKVGQPYFNKTVGCIELSSLRKLALTPPHIRANLNYTQHAREVRASFVGIWAEYSALGAIGSLLVALGASAWLGPLAPYAASIPFIAMLVLGRKKSLALFDKVRREICRPNTQESSLRDIAYAVLSAMKKRKLLPSTVTKDDIKITVRADGTYRVFLDNIEPAQSQVFMGSFTEAMAPITNQPYLIPKYEYFGAGEEEAQNETATASTEIIGQSQANPIYRVVQTARQLVLGKPKSPFEQREHQFCKNYLAGKAKPRIACYHAVPSLLARSEKGREAFEASWNKYVSPGFIVATETKPELLERYFGVGPSLAQRVLWE
ncbi:MAG TPA: DEAD/DEAH box helicase family protein [Trichormus sp.]